MKRHNFSGLRASHGVSISHRSHGSTGQRQDPVKSLKIKKWQVTWCGNQELFRILKIPRSDEVNGLLYLKGSIPAQKNSSVLIRQAKKI